MGSCFSGYLQKIVAVTFLEYTNRREKSIEKIGNKFRALLPMTPNIVKFYTIYQFYVIH